MHRFGLAAAALLLAAAPAAVAAPTREVQAEPSRPSIETAAAALDEFDYPRLTGDRAYAEQMLLHLETLAPLFGQNAEASEALDNLRALNLAVLDRTEEARGIVDGQLRAGSARAQSYTIPWLTAWHLSDPVLMLRSVEGVAQNVAPADRGPVFEAFEPAMVFSLDQLMKERGLDTERARLSEALVAMNWPGSRETDLDYFRKRLIDHRLRQNRRQDAARLAGAISAPRDALSLVTMRRYDGLIDNSAGAYLQRLLAAADRGTATALLEQPDNLDRVVDRIDHLRSVGRYEEAVAVARPFLDDVAATVALDRQGMWIVNNTAFALLTQGRTDEGVALMERLAALDIAEHPDLIGPMINYGAVLWQVGRHADSLAHAERLRPIAAEYANDYGRMWIASYAACANHALGRGEDAAARLGELRALPDANPAALNLALLCANDLDASEQLVIERLNSDDPDDMVLALQDYRFETSERANLDEARRRLRAVRERPAVRAALERVGRVLTLPVARTYYGSF